MPNPSKGEIEIEVINRYTPYAQGLDGYPVPPLPEDLVLPTDSPYVAIVGRNGSGKSTLLYKLFIQLMFGINETIGKYLDVKYTGKKPACRLIRGDDQPEPYLRSLEPKTDPERARLSRLSKGQYKWERLSRALSTDIPADTILFLDQPEDNLSIGNIRKLVGLLEGFLKQRGNQLFVATHCPELLGIDGLVINMLDWSRENPGGIASVCRTAEFDLSKYL
ncbi:AAA family ATPase [Candidatus Woesearchaeota archaeon]|nr:AAA family ATPase [Candidatus Woesearchaeota archaeon]